MRRILGLACLAVLCAAAPGAAARGDGTAHALWEIHGKHNTVYLLGSIHVLRPSDYPLAPELLDAYRQSQAIYMEVNLQDLDPKSMQTELLASAMLRGGKNLPGILGKQRYDHAAALARDVGVELSQFDQFAPWFAAEAISQMQLMQLGFQPQSGVEMYFLQRAKGDAKSVAGLETVHDQIALFEALTLDAQADYLLSSLEEAHDLPTEVDSMVKAWNRGDTQWFERQMKSEFGRDPTLYQSVLVARNRKWIPKIEALLEDDKNYLVIVGTGHLVGTGSVIDLLKKDGIGATQH